MVEEDSFLEELSRLKTLIKRRKKTAKKYLEKQDKRLQQCHLWREKQREAELLKTYVSSSQIPKNSLSIVLEDWESKKNMHIVLKEGLKPYEQVKNKFKEAKKLKIGLAFAEKEVEKAKETLNKYEEVLQHIENIKSAEDFKLLNEQYFLPNPQKKTLKEKKEKEVVKPYYEYFSSTKVPIWVGKSGAMNDLLTFKHASGNDLWLHAAEVPGSHIIIRNTSKEPLKDETLLDALQLALHHSKARLRGEVEVAMTYVKYVKKIGRAKGKVQIANEKRFLAKLDKKRLDKILSQSSLKR